MIQIFFSWLDSWNWDVNSLHATVDVILSMNVYTFVASLTKDRSIDNPMEWLALLLNMWQREKCAAHIVCAVFNAAEKRRWRKRKVFHFPHLISFSSYIKMIFFFSYLMCLKYLFDILFANKRDGNSSIFTRNKNRIFFSFRSIKDMQKNIFWVDAWQDFRIFGNFHLTSRTLAFLCNV